MRKAVLLGLVLMISLILAACGAEPASVTEPAIADPTPEPVEAVEEATETEEVERTVFRKYELPMGQTEDGAFFIGDENAPVTMIDYSNFLWGTCRAYVLGSEQAILREYVAAGDVKLVFWHNLDSSRFATHLHNVSHCAGLQDPEYFWRMHDYIFQSQTTVVQMSEAQLRSVVIDIGADGDLFDACMVDEGPAQVAELEAVAEERGVRSRPVFDINGAQLFGNLEYPIFADAIETAKSQ